MFRKNREERKDIIGKKERRPRGEDRVGMGGSRRNEYLIKGPWRNLRTQEVC